MIYELKRLLFFAGVLSSTCLNAAETSLSPLTTASTDGKAYAAKFAAGLSRDNGQTFITTAVAGENILIRGSITPDPAHVGKKGDFFVVESVGAHVYMRNTAGTFVPWNGSASDLLPAYDDVTLTASHTVELFKGLVNVTGDHYIFLGYLPEGGTGLIFTPAPLAFTINVNRDPLSLFENNVFDQIVMTKCTLCHVKGGVADGRTELLFLKDSNLDRQNFDLFKAFFTKRANAYDYVLSKVSGGDRHVGGVQLAKGSNDYNTMANFLAALEGREPGTAPASAAGILFNGVTLQSNLKTLRRAAILMAGRAPTAAEQAAVAAGDDNTLRTTLRNLMTGASFHEYVKDAANDRLLVRAEGSNILGECSTCFPNYHQSLHEAREQEYLTGIFPQWHILVTRSSQEVPLELIARVVENDLPYSEVLTADYMMMNPLVDNAVDGTATFASSSSTQFQPGKITSYYRRDSSLVIRQESRFSSFVLVNPGQLRTAYPHVGILSDFAFLARYPSTATNRNRARARWTYFHFLGVDIEQSAQRTTDPTALADTNNPTLKNPNCTVCHATMDPVAGAFQDFGDNGFYKESFGGLDSLDELYKFPLTNGNTPYQRGDTWYRDMLEPGINQMPASATNSLRWLAERIVADERFLSAAVRFWWPAVIGRELLKRPEVATDSDYQARLAAFDAQEATITTLAAKFRQSGMNVKTLFVDLMMSEWFRTERIDPSTATALQMQAQRIAGLGNEKLLTPEELERKTSALTGFHWLYNGRETGIATKGLALDYGLYYGGIDSKGVTQRTRDMTPLMSTVALTMALEISCPVIYGEFALPDVRRKLFGGMTELVTPLTEASQIETISSANDSDLKTNTIAAALEPGPKRISIAFTNDWCDFDQATRTCKSPGRDLFISGIRLQSPNGTTTTVAGPQLQLSATTCGGRNGDKMMLWNNCLAYYDFNAEQRGTYTVMTTLSANQDGTEQVKASITLEHNGAVSTSNARGAQLIRNKLVELHQTLLGQTLDAASPEIVAAYELLTQTWTEKRASNRPPHLFQPDSTCDWGADLGFLEYLGYPGNPLVRKTDGTNTWNEYAPWSVLESWAFPKGDDPTYMKQSWQVLLTYLLSHYDYLYE